MTLLDATAWTLVHFLWQGAIIVAVFAIGDAASRRASARVRYAIASVAMLLMVACAVTTFVHLMNIPGPGEQATTTTASSAIAPALTPGVSSVHESLPSHYLPWLVYLWMAGVTTLSMRLAVQWVTLERCRRRGIMLDDTWQERIGRIATQLRLRRAVRAYESVIADVPSVVGWLRPVILVPASTLLQLAPGQIEALLAHELAHVRRHDYLINLFQSCVETLFFYHPGVWWVGRRMREERENCCDDLAVAVCGDPMFYARALADLEQFRSGIPELAMAANGGSLLNRIERLIAPGQTARPIAPVGITALVLMMAVAFLWAAPQVSAPKPVPAKSQESYLDQIERAGYRNLTVDQMISMKIHGVNADYIAEIKSLGWSPTPDQLVAFRIHGVNAATVKELRALGYPLTPDQVVVARIHDVSSAYANGWKQEGLKGLAFDNLIALKIHGADPAQLRDLKTLGFGEVSADDLVSMRIAGVTPDFIRETRTRGFRDLRLDQIIQLKLLGILGSKEPN